jgi:hypothetical protein
MPLHLFAPIATVTYSNAAEPVWDANTIILQKTEFAPGVFGVFPEETLCLLIHDPFSSGCIDKWVYMVSPLKVSLFLKNKKLDLF